MFKPLLYRFLRSIAILFFSILIVFLLMHAAPGNPWSSTFNQRRVMLYFEPDGAYEREVIRHFGLDLPLWRQFTRYLIGDRDTDGTFNCGLVCGNMGPSIQQHGRSIENILFTGPPGLTFWQSQFGYSIRLVALAFLIATGLGIPLGILSAIKPRSALSRGISVFLAALISIPNFILGLLAIIILAAWLHVMKVLPDWTQFSNWILPASVLAVMPMASIARVTRASLMNIMHEDFIRTAYGKGLTKTRVMVDHLGRNAIVPVITFLGPTMMEMLGGLFIVESLYSFPGFGRGYWLAILQLDYPMIMGLTVVYATGLIVINTLIDILNEILDPRLRSLKEEVNP